MASSSQDPAHKRSRVLAALSGGSGTYGGSQQQQQQDTMYNPLKRKPSNSNGGTSAESSKRRATGDGIVPTEGSATDDEDDDAELTRLNALNISPHSMSQRLMNRSGFNLNYDFESPVRSIDFGGHDQQARMAEFVSKSIDNLSHGLTVRSAMEKLGLQDMKDILPGLEVRLLPHQIIGVSWMLHQEKETRYKGGILADDMGLGKTVQMIACMAMNLPPEDSSTKTTLIVVPSALLLQWKEELETKSNELFKVHIHHGSGKLRNVKALRDKDVVITTYQTLNTDFVLPADVEEGEEMEWVYENGGLLARTKWYRVILDEAQFIRNRNTRSSRSVAMLRAKYRWMLTGTPVTNTLADIYGLMRFGGFRPWNDWNDFNEYIAKMQHEDAPLAGLRAQEVLKPILLRRTKGSTLEGEPILKLPPKKIDLVMLEFTAEERDVYDSFEKRTRIRINRFIRARTLLKNHAIVLVMILRLRQLCCHPHLILSRADDFENPTDIMGDEKDQELARANKVMGIQWVAEVKQRFLKRALANETFEFSDEADEPEATCPVCKDLFMNNSGRVLTCGHEICFDCSLELMNAEIVHDGIFGYGTDQENLRAEKDFETAAAKGHRPCPTCKKMADMSDGKTFKASAFEPSDEELAKAERARRRQRAGKPASDDEAEAAPRAHARARRISAGVIDIDSDSSSDESLPDLADLFAGREGKKKVKKEVKKADHSARKNGSSSPVQDDEMIDLTMDDISASIVPSTPSRSSVRKDKTQPADGSDSDIEVLAESPFKSTPSNSVTKVNGPKSSQSLSAKAKGKQRARTEESDEGDEDDEDKELPVATGEEPSAEVFATWRKGDDDLEPSTKMIGLISLLDKWDSTGDKTICYSQWTTMLDLVEKVFARHGIRSLRYDGSMDRHAREQALANFKRAGGPKVILISTRCGSVGLNLCCANRVVNLDLSWNYAAEAQAYDRVHRLGQEKDVFVKRLVVRNTIEERLLELQDVKVGLAEAALGEGTGTKLHKLSVKQIKALFGMGPKKDDAAANGMQRTLDSHLASR